MVLISLIPGPHNTWQPQLRITVPIFFFFGGGGFYLKRVSKIHAILLKRCDAFFCFGSHKFLKISTHKSQALGNVLLIQ